MHGSEVKNARIESTLLGTEDHGIMSCFVQLDYGDSTHQGFGGYALDEPIRDRDGKFVRRVGSANGMEFVMQVLNVLEASSWEKLRGMYCRVRVDVEKPSGFGHKIVAIGNITKDKWFEPAKLWDAPEQRHCHGCNCIPGDRRMEP